MVLGDGLLTTAELVSVKRSGAALIHSAWDRGMPNERERNKCSDTNKILMCERTRQVSLDREYWHWASVFVLTRLALVQTNYISSGFSSLGQWFISYPVTLNPPASLNMSVVQWKHQTHHIQCLSPWISFPCHVLRWRLQIFENMATPLNKSVPLYGPLSSLGSWRIWNSRRDTERTRHSCRSYTFQSTVMFIDSAENL